jgi:hypothetical protein
MDCVAGIGIMSELGIGDEIMTEADIDVVREKITDAGTNQGMETSEHEKVATDETVSRQMIAEDTQAVESLPLVVISNYPAKGREDLVNVLAQWAAALVESRASEVNQSLQCTSDAHSRLPMLS